MKKFTFIGDWNPTIQLKEFKRLRSVKFQPNKNKSIDDFEVKIIDSKEIA